MNRPDHLNSDLARYHRQMLLPGIGEAGQRALLRARAVIVGCGALGCASADLLARAGVGRLTLIDRDVVELTNLQRQTLFTEADAAAGAPKAEAAARRLRAVNSEIEIKAVIADATHRNIERLAGLDATGNASGDSAGPVVLVDGTDNFQTRYLLNDVAVKHGVPYIYGGAVGTGGLVMPVLPARAGGAGPCLRCVFEEPPAAGTTPTCDTAGVLGPVVAMVAAMQAAAALRVLAQGPAAVEAALTEFDAWGGRVRRIDLTSARRADCPACGRGRLEYLDGSRAEDTAVLCGQRAVQVWPDSAQAGGLVDLQAMAERLRAHGTVASHEYLLRARLERERGREGGAIELTVFADGRAVVRGTDEVAVARAIYARYVGA